MSAEQTDPSMREAMAVLPGDSMRNQKGFTLIEVMVGMLIGLVVVIAAFATLTMTQKSLRVNEQVVDMQQNVRMAMVLLSRDVKLAGFGSPGTAIGNCTNAIVPNDQNPSGADTGPDSVQLLVPTIRSTGSNRWTLRLQTGSAGVTQLSLQPGAIADMQSSGFTNVDPKSYISIGGSATTQITNFDASTGTITVPMIPPPLWFQQEDPIYLLQCIRYRVVQAPDPTNLCGGKAPCLTRGVAGVTTGPNAEAVIAEGIEDLQLAYACDGCVATINGGNPDRVIDDQNGNGSFDQADFLRNVSWAAAPRTPDTIQLVQIVLVARQSRNDQGLGETNAAVVGSSSQQITPDRLIPADPNHRRRVLRETVETRNVGL